jgi:hypothetical protein
VLRRVTPLVVGLLLLAVPTPITLARYTDAAASTGTVRSDTLDPPTSLAASGGATITLTWAVTPDAYATGYTLYRATSAGGTYALVATITPRSSTSYVDDPGNGTFWYRLRASFQSWESVDSNTVSATDGTTLYKPCTSNAPDTTGAGDNNGYQSNPARVCADDGSFATDSNSGTGGTQSCGAGATPDATKDRHRFWGYALGLPGTVTSINGIRVRADLALNDASGTTNLCAQLSWDGGTTWTTIKTQAIPAAAETTYVFGSTSDTWGRTWTPAQLNTTNFRVRIIDASSLTTKQFQLDYVAVSVTYTP